MSPAGRSPLTPRRSTFTPLPVRFVLTVEGGAVATAAAVAAIGVRGAAGAVDAEDAVEGLEDDAVVAVVAVVVVADEVGLCLIGDKG